MQGSKQGFKDLSILLNRCSQNLFLTLCDVGVSPFSITIIGPAIPYRPIIGKIRLIFSVCRRRKRWAVFKSLLNHGPCLSIGTCNCLRRKLASYSRVINGKNLFRLIEKADNLTSNEPGNCSRGGRKRNHNFCVHAILYLSNGL